MKCTNPLSVTNKRYSKRFKRLYPNATKELLVPCGKCKACLHNYINSWNFRFQLQSRTSLYSSFVTLTYDDIYLPVDGVSKSEIQRFFKRVRKHFDSGLNLKYCLIAEYGPTTFRPHYHFLSFSDYPICYEDFWKSGFVTQDEIIPERLTYISKYHVIKGLIQPKGKNPTFRLCSRGLGLEAFKEFEYDNAILNGNYIFNDEGFPIPIPKYFRDKCDLPRYVNPPIVKNKKVHKSINESISQNTTNFINKLSKKSKL